MVTIQSFICNKAKGQLEGHEASLNNRFLEVTYVFPFWELVKKAVANLNTTAFWMSFHLRSSRKLPQVRFRGVFRRLPKMVQCCWQEEKQQADVWAERSPFRETIPGLSMRETGKEDSSEQRWESLTWACTCLKIDLQISEFQVPKVTSDRYSH